MATAVEPFDVKAGDARGQPFSLNRIESEQAGHKLLSLEASGEFTTAAVSATTTTKSRTQTFHRGHSKPGWIRGKLSLGGTADRGVCGYRITSNREERIVLGHIRGYRA